MKRIDRVRRWGFFTLLVMVGGLLAGCRAQPSPSTATATLPPVSTLPASTPLPAPTPTSPTPTPAPRSLVVCLGEEPKSLYIYGQTSVATWNVLEAIYDGPIDRRNYSPQPVILEKIPSLPDGDAVISPVAVQRGDEVLDANGELATLTTGEVVRPAGCHQSSCAVTWDGTSELKMDQLTVTFKLKPGLLWSDGQALKASDSVYSFKLSADPATPVSKYAVDRTASYKAKDNLTVVWQGKPGYLDPQALTNFWMPLPEHLWGMLSPADLPQAEAASMKPVGWGPYIIDEWVKGDHLTLHKNPNYFRAKEGLPRFDHLVYRFVGTKPGSALTALLAGECDVVDRTARLDEQLPALLELQNNKKVQAFLAAGPEWEHIDFGIKPAAYDDGYKAGDRPQFFTDVRVRQAFALCLDRQAMVDQYLQGQSQVIDSFLPPQNPLYNASVPEYGFDPAAGNKLLDEAGWKDADNNPSTPRVASGVKGVPDGTPLVVNYFTTQAPLRTQAAGLAASSLAQCGIQVKLQNSAPADLFAPGPQGPVFGRQFDLVQFSWESSAQPPCFLYQSSHIPSDANHWIGENISGYSNPEFDAACADALDSLPGLPGYTEANARSQELFSRDLPGIPLYLLVKAAAARPGVCGITFDSSARSDLATLEGIDEGQGCTVK